MCMDSWDHRGLSFFHDAWPYVPFHMNIEVGEKAPRYTGDKVLDTSTGYWLFSWGDIGVAAVLKFVVPQKFTSSIGTFNGFQIIVLIVYWASWIFSFKFVYIDALWRRREARDSFFLTESLWKVLPLNLWEMKKVVSWHCHTRPPWRECLHQTALKLLVFKVTFLTFQKCQIKMCTQKALVMPDS